MTKEYIKTGTLIIFSLFLLSCKGQSYYKKVRDNIGDFRQAIAVLNQKQMLQLRDSILLQNTGIIKVNNKCVYKEEMKDPLIGNFMNKYDLTRICFSKYNNEFFDSAITFHKEHTPFFGKAIIVTYDFGKSGLRDLIDQERRIKDEKVKVINNEFIYRVRPKPAFGE
jgi:hypothetical protein